MGITKSNLFTEAQNHLANLAKALGHPARIAILQHLMAQKACVTGYLVEELGLAQPTISQHLKELKDAGLIQGSIEGPRMQYCIEPTAWKAAQALFQGLFDDFTHENACC